eukprot:3274502-Pyramimonas_sp.AAC.1
MCIRDRATEHSSPFSAHSSSSPSAMSNTSGIASCGKPGIDGKAVPLSLSIGLAPPSPGFGL